MGTYQPGIFGPFNGTVGNVVATKWKGKDIVKNSPVKTNKKASLDQVDQRQRFKLVNEFLGRFSDFIAEGYRSVGNKQIPINVALTYHLQNALTGVYPNYELDYSKVKLSLHNRMDPVSKPGLFRETDDILSIKWQMPRMMDINSRPDDLVFIMCYNPAKRSSLKSQGKRRYDLLAELLIPEFYRGDEVHCWMFFVSVDGAFTSETQYLGSFI